MSLRYRSRIPYVDPDNPQSWGRDDYTGLPVMHPDLIKQMEYFGTGLAWTGFMVHFKDADQPNPQNVPPRLKVDPIPIPNPRYLTLQDLPNVPDRQNKPLRDGGSLVTGVTLTGTTTTSISITWIPIQGAQSYVVSWYSTYSSGEERRIIGQSFTINGLARGNSYFVQVASTQDDSVDPVTGVDNGEFSTSAFSAPINVILPTI